MGPPTRSRPRRVSDHFKPEFTGAPPAFRQTSPASLSAAFTFEAFAAYKCGFPYLTDTDKHIDSDSQVFRFGPAGGLGLRHRKFRYRDGFAMLGWR
jgi:hypothetical protein